MKKYLKVIPGKGLSKNKPSCENAVSPVACVASVSVRFGSKEFRAGKIPKIPFPGLSLLPNLTETLAT